MASMSQSAPHCNLGEVGHTGRPRALSPWTIEACLALSGLPAR